MEQKSQPTSLQKITFSAKIAQKYGGFKKESRIFFKNLINSSDFKSACGLFFEIIFLGVLSNLALAMIGVRLNVFNVFALGSAFWLIKERVVPMIVQILGAFKLVNK